MEIKEEENRPVMVYSPLFGCVDEAAIFYGTVGREYFLEQMAQFSSMRTWLFLDKIY